MYVMNFILCINTIFIITLSSSTWNGKMMKFDENVAICHREYRINLINKSKHKWLFLMDKNIRMIFCSSCLFWTYKWANSQWNVLIQYCTLTELGWKFSSLFLNYQSKSDRIVISGIDKKSAFICHANLIICKLCK